MKEKQAKYQAKGYFFFAFFGRESVLIASLEIVFWIQKFVRYHAIYFMFYSI